MPGRELLGERGYESCFAIALETMLDDIREDLEEFGVVFDRWFSERELDDSGALHRALDRLESGGWLYTENGARWFRSSELGDDKDRVVVRENGRTTYFASDIAYLLDKLERCPGKLIYIFGADHHGYVPRLKAAARGLGEDPDRLEFPLVQFAVLYRGGEKIQMSTRSGEFTTLRSCAKRSATMPRAISTSCARTTSTWTSIWTWPSRGPTKIRCSTSSMRTPASTASSASSTDAA